MLNPDGVANGYTRLDTNGYNLNARYASISLRYSSTNHLTPTIYSLKKLIGYLSKEKVLHAYIDLHAHTTKRGIFFFSNPLNEQNYQETLEIPYLFYLFDKDFSFKGSRFGVQKGESTSRKVFYRETKCNRLYVLETNYWGETRKLKDLKAKNLVKDNLSIVRNFGKFYTLGRFAQMGTNLAKSIVKAGEMEILRLSGAAHDSLKNLQADIRKRYLKLKKKSQKRKNNKKKKTASSTSKPSSPKEKVSGEVSAAVQTSNTQAPTASQQVATIDVPQSNADPQSSNQINGQTR